MLISANSNAPKSQELATFLRYCVSSLQGRVQSAFGGGPTQGSISGDFMTEDKEYSRMRWASRRGLLELDLLLGPFMESCFRQLEPQLREDYQQLMSHEDQDILNWIMGRVALSDESLIAITDQIRAHNRSKLR